MILQWKVAVFVYLVYGLYVCRYVSICDGIIMESLLLFGINVITILCLSVFSFFTCNEIGIW